MADWQGRRRVYDKVRVIEEDGGYFVHLDKSCLKSPAGTAVRISARRMAETVAAEWDAQEAEIDAATMPMTAFACTLVDRVGSSRLELATNVIGFAETDTLCYRVNEPEDLVQRQQDVWQPLLDWAATELEAPLTPTTGIVLISQPEVSIQNLTVMVTQLPDTQLLGVATAAATTGSLVLAIALLKNRLTADEVADAAILEEQHRLETWGGDDEAEARIQSIRTELRNTERYLSLL